jgi:hypothetical protein
MLDYVALFMVFFLIVALAAVIVFIGSLPGKIARQRNHPWPDAVNAASWIGLATGVLWPFAFVWAFLPVPVRGGQSSQGGAAPSDELARIHDKLSALESAIAKLQPPRGADQQ